MRGVILFLALGALFAVGGCAPGTDGEQLDLCRRVLPALHAEGTELREIRFGYASPDNRGGIRIDYAAREPGAVNRARYVVCRFGDRDRGERLDLAALETDSGTLGEARILILKRFWLGSPNNAAAGPGSTPSVLEVPRAIAYAAQQWINAIVLAAIYGLLAVACSLIYGLVGRIVMSFGRISVVGAYAVIGGVATVLISGVGGFALALPAFSLDPIALARAEGVIVTIAPAQIYIAAIAIAASLALLSLMRRTSVGRQWRVFAADPVAATLAGVSPAWVWSVTFVLAGFSAGLAGWILAVSYGNVSFSMGTVLGLKALLAAIIGGIGRIEGALIGGILIGLVEAVWSAYFDTGMRDIVVFSILIVMFVLRPGGLLGLSGPHARDA